MKHRQTVKRWVSPFGVLGVVVCCLRSFAPALAQPSSGPEGIDALVLHQPPYNLTGRKIAIGQVEIGRLGQFGFDKVAPRNRALPAAGVFFRDQRAERDEYVDDHAHNVASIMVSSDKAVPGVAPDAKLYGAAAGRVNPQGQPEECLTTSRVARQNNDEVRAINFSFGEALSRDPRPDARLDGNAHLTLCVDWSARVHDVLYVVAGNQGGGGISIPTDNYNGVNVSFSKLWQGSFSKVDFANLGDELERIGQSREGLERNLNGRRSIDLVAPGHNINLLDLDGRTIRSSGTSFAAPHVTATVALLQQYGDRQGMALNGSGADSTESGSTESGWIIDNSRRHEVMKAVLLNAADKIEDRGQGRYLGMTRTLLDQKNRTWLQSPAYRDPATILDLQTGAGHLNAFRAYQQFSAGQQSGGAVAAIGWDYNQVSAIGNNTEGPRFQDYVLAQPLQGNTFVAITLTWDRWVELRDTNGNDQYDLGETFVDRGLNNLDLYLMPAEATDVSQSIWSSVSRVDCTEHIFQEIPRTGRYKIRVQYGDQINEAVQPYGLAWWGVPVAP